MKRFKAAEALEVDERLRKELVDHLAFDPSGCWLWRGRVLRRPSYPSGKIHEYGYLYLKRSRRTYAHRVAFVLFKQPLKDGEYLYRVCSNTLCCNPDHMRVLSNGELAKITRGEIV
jgi:hypothetical protein